jgi:hypothetical protein
VIGGTAVARLFAMTKTRTVDNTNRPAQPEPGEDEATQQPSVRENAPDQRRVEQAKEEEKRRQTGE